MQYEEKKRIVLECLDELRKEGKIRTQVELAEAIGMNRAGLSAALNSRPETLSDAIVARVVKLKKEMLGEAPAAPAAPDVVIPGATAKMYADMAAVIRSQQETIALLASQLAGVAVSGGGFSGNVGARTDQAK